MDDRTIMSNLDLSIHNIPRGYVALANPLDRAGQLASQPAPILEPEPTGVTPVPDLDHIQPFLSDPVQVDNMQSGQSTETSADAEAQLKAKVKYALDQSWKHNLLRYSVSASRGNLDQSYGITREEYDWITGLKTTKLRYQRSQTEREMADIETYRTWEPLCDPVSWRYGLSDHNVHKELDTFYGDDTSPQHPADDVNMDEGFAEDEEEVSMVATSWHSPKADVTVSTEDHQGSVGLDDTSTGACTGRKFHSFTHNTFRDVKDSGIFVEENFAREAGRISPLLSPCYTEDNVREEVNHEPQILPSTLQINNVNDKNDRRNCENNSEARSVLAWHLEDSASAVQDVANHVDQRGIGTLAYFNIDGQAEEVPGFPFEDFPDLTQEIEQATQLTPSHEQRENPINETSDFLLGTSVGINNDAPDTNQALFHDEVHHSVHPFMLGAEASNLISINEGGNNSNTMTLQSLNDEQPPMLPQYGMSSGGAYWSFPNFAELNGYQISEGEHFADTGFGPDAQVLGELQAQAGQPIQTEHATNSLDNLSVNYGGGREINNADFSLLNQHPASQTEQLSFDEHVSDNNDTRGHSLVNSNAATPSPFIAPLGYLINSPVEGYFPCSRACTPQPSSPQKQPHYTPPALPPLQPLTPVNRSFQNDESPTSPNPASWNTTQRSGMRYYKPGETVKSVKAVFNSPNLRLMQTGEAMQGAEAFKGMLGEGQQAEEEAEGTIVVACGLRGRKKHVTETKGSDDVKGETFADKKDDGNNATKEDGANNPRKMNTAPRKSRKVSNVGEKELLGQAVTFSAVGEGKVEQTKVQPTKSRRPRKSNMNEDAEIANKQSGTSTTEVSCTDVQNTATWAKSTPKPRQITPAVKLQTKNQEAKQSIRQGETPVEQKPENKVPTTRRPKSRITITNEPRGHATQAPDPVMTREPPSQVNPAPQKVPSKKRATRKSVSSVGATVGPEISLAATDHTHTHNEPDRATPPPPATKKPRRSKRTSN